jgi:hypothetical protein
MMDGFFVLKKSQSIGKKVGYIVHIPKSVMIGIHMEEDRKKAASVLIQAHVMNGSMFL